jgi:hypothetical protein
MLMVFALVALIGCSTSTDSVEILKGDPGKDGTNGTNGHSLVSQFVAVAIGSLECADGGTSLDLYMDNDDSLDVSSADLYTGSLIACNGANGLNGIAGLDGTNGADGNDGVDGTNGNDGADGANGADGTQGIPGAIGPQGVAGPQGIPGPQGIAGPVGPVGPQGPQGTQGAQGPAGSGATITTYTSNSCTLIAGTSYYQKSASIYSNNTCTSSHRVANLNGSTDTFWVGTSKLAVANGGNGLKVISFN